MRPPSPPHDAIVAGGVQDGDRRGAHDGAAGPDFISGRAGQAARCFRREGDDLSKAAPRPTSRSAGMSGHTCSDRHGRAHRENSKTDDLKKLLRIQVSQGTDKMSGRFEAAARKCRARTRITPAR